MPELPEVETTRRGIEPYVVGYVVEKTIVRERRLRWPVPKGLEQQLRGQRIDKVSRRGKYLLLHTQAGTLLIHLGMSGSLRILPCETTPLKHDHVDIVLSNKQCLRLRDPRRFGCVLWISAHVSQHELLKNLGPEPLSDAFNKEYLYSASRKRKVAIKQFIMNSHIVVGVGNIYANEALFLAGIRPGLAAGRLSKPRCQLLIDAIKTVLTKAIKQGGTTLRDFTASDGNPGYFQMQLNVYGRSGEPCHQCGTSIKSLHQGQRATYYCPKCQK
ncbi:bifunctional DNA-formamidopyrimidine glycosylase/DNA-(apurinic or apyrimidinic site) lyase [Kaarinaea lacus]